MGNPKITVFGENLIDITDSTVAANKMLKDTVAYDSDAEKVTGTIETKTSTDVTVSGATVTTPSGYYASQVQKSVATGTAGTPSANKGSVTNHQISITPTVANTTGYITGGTKNGTAVTVSASDLVSGSETKSENGNYNVTNLASLIVNVVGGDYDVQSQVNGSTQTLLINTMANGGSVPLPFGITAMDYGEITIDTAFTTTAQTFSHSLGVTPDFMMVYAESNIATTYSMLGATRGSIFNWRSGYGQNYAYHGNSTTTVTWANTNYNYGISAMTATTFSLASSSTSYYWRKGTYKYIAIKL